MISRETSTTPVPASVTKAKAKRSRMSGARRREAMQGYMYISPWIIGFSVFVVGPLIASLYYSFTYYPLMQDPTWIGLENYITALFKDRIFWVAVQKTLTWAIIVVPLGIIGSFTAAMLLNRAIRGKTAFRVLFFLPSLTPEVAAAVLWVWILQPDDVDRAVDRHRQYSHVDLFGGSARCAAGTL
jgi:multiple sugar transport system permease protein